MSALTPCPQGIEGRTATGTVRQQVSQSVRIIWQVAASCDTDGSRYFYGWQPPVIRMAAGISTDGSRYFYGWQQVFLRMAAGISNPNQKDFWLFEP
jgi:hypothetical protein